MSAREPLGPDEQALAGRLQSWSVAEPATALDQRILAQARAAVARPVRRPRPWLVGLASAATLVLAVGVVWRVLEAPAPGLSSTPAPVPQMRADGPTAASDAAPAQPAEKRVEPEAPEAPTQRARRQATPDQNALHTGADRAEARVPEPVAAPASPPAEAIREHLPAPSEAARGTPLPQAPPAPPPPARPESAGASAGAAPAFRSPRTREDQLDRSEPAAEALIAAIGRIRALVARGEIAAARQAIGDLRRHHPEVELPPDLATIEAEPAR